MYIEIVKWNFLQFFFYTLSFLRPFFFGRRKKKNSGKNGVSKATLCFMAGWTSLGAREACAWDNHWKHGAKVFTENPSITSTMTLFTVKSNKFAERAKKKENWWKIIKKLLFMTFHPFFSKFEIGLLSGFVRKSSVWIFESTFRCKSSWSNVCPSLLRCTHEGKKKTTLILYRNWQKINFASYHH